MNAPLKKASKALALLVAFSVMQVYVLANHTSPSVAMSSTAISSAPAGLLFGRLQASGNQPVIVNGNRAISGSTIFSGAQLQTPATGGASVQIASLGKLEVSPDTNLTLSFDKEGVNVNVTKGSAFLTTLEGIKGSLTTPDGKTSSAESAAAIGVGSPSPKMTPHQRNITIGVVVAIIAVVVIVVVATRNSNPSPSR